MHRSGEIQVELKPYWHLYLFSKFLRLVLNRIIYFLQDLSDKIVCTCTNYRKFDQFVKLFLGWYNN